MLLPLSKQLGRKPASALENQQLGVHRYKMFLAIIGLFKICKPIYAREETYQSKNVVLWSDNCGKNKNCSASLSSESKYGEWDKSFSS